MKAATIKQLKEGRDKMEETLTQAKCINVLNTRCPRCGSPVTKQSGNPRFRCLCGWESDKPNGVPV